MTDPTCEVCEGTRIGSASDSICGDTKDSNNPNAGAGSPQNQVTHPAQPNSGAHRSASRASSGDQKPSSTNEGLGSGGEDIIFGVLTLPFGGEGFAETAADEVVQATAKEGAEALGSEGSTVAGKTVKDVLEHDPLKGTKTGTLEVRQNARSEYAQLNQRRGTPQPRPRTGLEKTTEWFRVMLRLLTGTGPH